MHSTLTEKQTKKLMNIFQSKRKLETFKTVDDLKIGKHIGKGYFSTCFSLGDDMVIKTNKHTYYIEDDGNPFWIEHCIKSKSVHVPKIYFYVEKDGHYLAVMEKLHQITEIYVYDIVRYVSEKVFCTSDYYYKLAKNEAAKTCDLKTLNKIAALIKDSGFLTTDYSLDLSTENVMKRTDGTLVILDPFGSC